MIIEATAPTRIDLAGGILDINPIYVFENGCMTLNAAINLKTTVHLKLRDDHRIRIYSEDLKEKQEADSLEELQPGGSMDLIVRILKFYDTRRGLDVVAKSSLPADSGLGSSSSLLIALSTALNHLLGEKYSKDDLIQLGANLEAQSLGFPTGKQDYYPAAFGGINALWFGLDHDKVEPLQLPEQRLEELNHRLILSYTGASRASAVSNWKLIKCYIDRIGNTVQLIRSIKQTALSMREALISGDLERFGELISEEWENRKWLAEGATSERIESVIAAARQAGAAASKICGPGGGGCMITFVKPGTREAVIGALEGAGAAVLNYALDMHGARVRVSR